MSKCAIYSGIGFACLLIGAVASGVAVYFIVQPSNSDLIGICILEPSPGNTATGTLHFDQSSSSEDLYITGNITGLSAGKHGFHIHTLGVVGGQCAMAQGHYNPHEEKHGGPGSKNRHIGDLGNIESEGEDSYLIVHIEDSEASLYGEYSIFGRSIVIHAGEDDLGPNSSSGNAGGRVTCCTIMHSY